MDFQKLLAEAEKIADPVEREKRINEIMREMLGNPVRAAIASPPIVPLAVEPRPEDVQQLYRDIDLTKKLGRTTNVNAFSDEELEQLIGGFSGNVPPEAAEAEAAARKRIDEQSLLQNAVDPKALLRKAGQVVGGAAEIPTSSPIGLVGLLAKGAEFATGADLSADEIMLAAEDIRQKVKASVGISDPRNISESAANLLPNFISVPGSVKSTLGNLAEIVTPVVVGSGNKRILANFATGLVADQAMRELGDTAADKYKTGFDEVGFTGGVVDDVNYPEAMKAIGIGLAGMAGASIVTPMLLNTLKSARRSQMHPLVPIESIDPHGPKNLYTLEKAGDLYKTYFVDEKTALTDIARRARMPDFDEVSKLIDQDTQMSALMRVNEAMRTGALRTKNGSFQVDITPNQLHAQYSRLPPALQTDADMYLKYNDFADILTERIRRNIDVAENQQLLRQANQSAYEISLRSPIVKDFAAQYQHITEKVRDFLGQGNSAMLSQKAIHNLSTKRKNFVPSDVLGVNPEDNLLARISDATRPIEQRQMDNWYRQHTDDLVTGVENKANSYESLVDYTRNALKSKMENDVRGAYVQALKNSEWGPDTIRLASKREMKLHPERIVEVWEQGKRVKYITSRLQATLLKFDPYVAKYPTAFYAKRLFEQGATGPLSLTFAPMTALRDSLGGWVFSPKGVKGPGSLEVMTSIPKQIWAKSQLAAVEMLQNNMSKIPFLPQASRQQLAQQISNSYMNSMYHLANEVGGFDASLMKHNIQAARGAMREISKSAAATGAVVPGLNTLGRSARALFHGFETVFDAIQEAPRFAAFQRNVRRGMDPSDAARYARDITGDATRSGRVYDPRGVRIDADAINKSAKIGAPIAGPAVEFLRETTPYFNPMVQGMRKMANSFIDNPYQTNIRAWSAVGLPALVMMGWNEMLGEDYNRFAFEERTSRDIAMNMYMGIPGLPPEQGAQIPIPHELTLFNSPWTTALYGMMRGGDSDEIKGTMMHMAGTSLENSAMVGFPQGASAALSMMGMKPPQSILNPLGWQDEIYQIREDNVGMMPQNVELMLRSVFGSIADTALTTGAALYEGGPEAFFDELGQNVLKRTPIVKNVAGTTTPVTNFTPLSEQRQNKLDALFNFLDIYEEHIQKEKLIDRTKLTDAKGLVEDTDAMTRHRIAPIPTPAPTNPVVLEYGDLIKETLDNNELGAGGLRDRYSLFTKQLRNLRAYTSGRKDAFRDWQKTINGKDAEWQAAMTDLEAKKPMMKKREYTAALKELDTLSEAAKLDRLLKDNKIDMSKRSDVLKLISIMERERIEMMKEQLKLIETIEDKVTGDLVNRGMLRPGQKFSIEKHLGRLPPKEFLPSQRPSSLQP